MKYLAMVAVAFVIATSTAAAETVTDGPLWVSVMITHMSPKCWFMFPFRNK